MKQLIINILYTTLIISLSLSCIKKASYEEEPNHFLDNANPIGLNQSIKGNFQNIKDEDSYILDLRQEKKEQVNVSIELKQIKGYDIAFNIYEGNELIKIIDDYHKSKDEKIYSIALTKQIYYIVVKVSTLHNIFYKRSLNKIKPKQYPTTDYLLSVREKKLNPFYEIEPNDTMLRANPIKINTFIEGSFAPFYNLGIINNNNLFNNKKLNSLIQKLEHDWYFLDLDNKGEYNLSINLEGTNNIDAILGIYHNNFNKLVNNKKSGEGETIINLSVKGQQRYYIIVSGIPHAYKSNNKENYPYRLSININSKDTEAEPNNSITKANIINDNFIYGMLSPKNDEDFYILNLTENPQTNINEKEEYRNLTENIDIKSTGKKNINKSNTNLADNITGNYREQVNRNKTLSAFLSPVSKLDLALYLYNEHGNLIRIYDNNGINKEEQIQSFNINKLKRIILCVRGSYQNKNDNYKESYKLEVKIKEHKANYELEPNDKIKTLDTSHKAYEQTNKIETNRIVYGYINPGGKNPYQQSDIDNFEVKLKYNTNYKVSLKGVEELDIKLSIYYRDKSPVHNFNIIKSIDGKTETSILKVPYDPFDPDSNIYNIKIETEFTKKGNSNKTYSFILQELPPR